MAETLESTAGHRSTRGNKTAGLPPAATSGHDGIGFVMKRRYGRAFPSLSPLDRYHATSQPLRWTRGWRV
jgi:hypothetical protein